MLRMPVSLRTCQSRYRRCRKYSEVLGESRTKLIVLGLAALRDVDLDMRLLGAVRRPLWSSSSNRKSIGRALCTLSRLGLNRTGRSPAEMASKSALREL